MNKKLNWRIIKKLHRLYLGKPVPKGSTRNKNSFINHPYIKRLYDKRYIKDKIGNGKVFIKQEYEERFNLLYKKEFVDKEGNFTHDIYADFLQSINVNIDKTNLLEDDIKRLIELKTFWTDDKLVKLRWQIINARENLQGVSNMFFKATKYVAANPSLETAVKALIGIEKFVESSELYLKPFNCKHKNAKITILCENFYFLKFPHHIQENEIELMYVGGYNVKRLKNLVDVQLPIYYLCDWDFDGLKIYEKAKEIIDNLDNNIYKLKILTPNGKSERVCEPKGFHGSEWKNKEQFICGLNPKFYNKEQIILINHLIKKDEWIEEEGNCLKKLIETIK